MADSKIARTFLLRRSAAEELRRVAFQMRVSQTEIVREALYNLWISRRYPAGAFAADESEENTKKRRKS